MLSAGPKYKEYIKDFNFKANKDTIKNKNNIKILGVILQRDLGWDIEIGTICANLHNRLNNIKKVAQYTNFITRKELIFSIVLGKLQYAMPLYTNINNNLITKIHSDND